MPGAEILCFTQTPMDRYRQPGMRGIVKTAFLDSEQGFPVDDHAAVGARTRKRNFFEGMHLAT